MNDEPMYAGTHEAAKILGISKQGVSNLRDRGGMPKPVATLAIEPIWLIADINELRDARQDEADERQKIADATANLKLARESRKRLGHV